VAKKTGGAPKKRRSGKPATRDTIPGLAARLVAARTAAGISQSETARRSGVARENLIRYEQGSKGPTLRIVYLLARAYGVEVSELLPPVADVLGPAPPAEGEPKGT